MAVYDQMNERQKEAMLCTEGPELILAGAGSGKTRVLTHRIAYLISEKNVRPWHIMAITFTNKAAGEMRERVDRLVGEGAEQVWVATFHSTCVRILRRFIDRIGYDSSFTIYDTDDQKTLMKQVFKELNIDTRTMKERNVLARISAAKNEMTGPEEFRKQAENYYDEKAADCYERYQAGLRKNNALDFDDLLVKTVQLFRAAPDVLDYYQERFRYIMVDEYQDTNTVQFCLVELLAKKYGNLCVVGDDDQSIYKFRGANIRNILSFEEAFPGAHVVRLEQNYRSAGNILDAANEVIRNNRGRKEKHLWTEEEKGELVHVRRFETAREEASGVIGEIARRARNGEYRKYAVLYRTNAQSRLLEE
ncbi:MAG: UvrD-helicase domain-containing protein, partial [Stomatobaculum sp.]|nr:UvrD-helicase domain-containing protein [Stomatobaculum sp.]